MKLQRHLVVLVSLFAFTLALAAAGCGNKTADNTAGSAASDSMLSSTPVEQPQGQLQPQGTPDQSAQQTAPAPVSQSRASTPVHRPAPAPRPAAAPSATVAGGTGLGITVGTAITSETASPGSAWSGTLKEAVIVGNTVVFPAGASVNGVVAGAKPAARGDRAFLLLEVTNIGGHDISAMSDSMIAGSTTKRNVGAVVGGAAAGALIGKAMGGSGKGALIGGILGGAAATGAVAASKGFQVEVQAGKDIVFHVNHDTKVKV